jgi:hypothetical protein
VIGILSDQHLRDQRFGGNAAFDDPRWCRGLERFPIMLDHTRMS